MNSKLIIVVLFLLGQVMLAGAVAAASRTLHGVERHTVFAEELSGAASRMVESSAATKTGSVVRPDESLAQVLASSGISLDEAASRVRRQTGGRIIKATARNQNGRTIYHIRVLSSDGRVFTVRVDAASGRVL